MMSDRDLPLIKRPGRDELTEFTSDLGSFLPAKPGRREVEVAEETRLRIAVQKGRAILEKLAIDHRTAARAYAVRKHLDTVDTMLGMLDEPRSPKAKKYAEQIVHQHVLDLYIAITALLHSVDEATRQTIEAELYPRPDDEEELSWWRQLGLFGGSRR